MSIVDKFKRHGLRGAWLFFSRRVIKTYLIKAHYLRLNIDPAKIESLMKGFDLDVKELTYEDFLLGDPNEFQGSKMDVYRKRFQDPTYKAYGIIENGRLVYSTWISYHKMGMSIEAKPQFLADNEGYLEDSYCDPVARGRGLHGKMNNYRIQKIMEDGKERVIVIVQEGNTPAFKVQFKSGLEEIGTFYHGYILGIKVNTYKKEQFEGK